MSRASSDDEGYAVYEITNLVADLGAASGASYLDYQHTYLEQKVEDELNELFESSKKDAEDDESVTAISVRAYKEAERFLLYIINKTSIPDIMPLDDGGISFEWRQGNEKIFTMSIYGDGHYIYSGIFAANDRERGTKRFLRMAPWCSRELLNILKEHFPNV